MKLRNKKTGEVIETDYELSVSVPNDEKFYGNATYTQIKGYSSIKELAEDWEDYEEDENFYVIGPSGKVGSRFKTHDGYEEDFKEIGNYFETREEAEKAVEKLKAWKRLKDKGIRFEGIKEDYTRILQSQEPFRTGKRYLQFNKSEDEEWMKENWEDLQTIFGGEE